jgi:signal transduction histidine kinase
MATNEVRKGNYRLNLHCEQGNEIGKLTQSFDMMGKELEQSLLTREKLERERKELVANISHDIKTPIASIKAYSEGLRDGIADHPEMAKKYIDVILEKANSLTKLVNDLLEHSLQDLGNFKINLVECYSQQMLINIITPLQIQLSAQGCNLTIDGEIPDVLIKADIMRLEQVIANIIQNAVKYTKLGKIIFKAVIEDNCLLISIKDNGMGIPPEEIPFIFERFYRGEHAKNSKVDGSGLGLSICKYIVEQHGGNIFVESAVDKGSTFYFTIPKS